MGRFMYVHFGDDVPRNIEKEYTSSCEKNDTLRSEMQKTE